MLEEYERLAFRVDVRSVEGVAGDDVDVFWEVLLEGLDFRVFAGRLAADDGPKFGSCSQQTGWLHGHRE